MSHPHSPGPWQQGPVQQPPPRRDDYGQAPGTPQYPTGPAPQGPAGGYGYPAPAWGQQPVPQGYGGYSPYQGPPRRPGTVLGGAILTYIGSGFMILVALALLIGSASSSFLEGVGESAAASGLSTGAIRAVVLVVGAVFLVLGIVLIILAAYAQRGRNGARITLTVIGGIEIGLGMLSVITGSPQTIVSVLYVSLALALFWVGGASNWYSARKAAR